MSLYKIREWVSTSLLRKELIELLRASENTSVGDAKSQVELFKKVLALYEKIEPTGFEMPGEEYAVYTYYGSISELLTDLSNQVDQWQSHHPSKKEVPVRTWIGRNKSTGEFRDVGVLFDEVHYAITNEPYPIFHLRKVEGAEETSVGRRVRWLTSDLCALLECLYSFGTFKKRN